MTKGIDEAYHNWLESLVRSVERGTDPERYQLQPEEWRREIGYFLSGLEAAVVAGKEKKQRMKFLMNRWKQNNL